MKYDRYIPNKTLCFDILFKQYFIIQNKWTAGTALTSSLQKHYCLCPCTHPTSTGPAFIDRPCI